MDPSVQVEVDFEVKGCALDAAIRADGAQEDSER
jgi:hypothetical protein